GQSAAGGDEGPRTPHVRDEPAAEARLEEPRGDGGRVGRAHPALGQPRPRESVRITEVQRAPEPAPAVGAIEESELPVVDVEDQRPWAAAASEQAEAEAR